MTEDTVVDEQTEVVNTPTSTASTSNFDDPNSVDYVGEPTVVDKEFVFVSHLDPARQRDNTGVYLDEVQRRQAEIQRAQIEQREPDLVNPPAIQGTPMITMGQAVQSYPTDAVIGVVDKTVTLPVSVGIADENLDGYGDAIKRREENSANEEGGDSEAPAESPDETPETPNDNTGNTGNTENTGNPDNTETKATFS